jgi:hypothetical protein
MAVKLERRIGIQAPDEVVWEILSDISGWGDWTGIYPAAQGEIRIGNRWILELALPGESSRTINPVILDWAPYDHIHWRHDMLRGWARTVRYLEIEKMGEENVIFSNGEIFDGLLGPTIARRMRRKLLDGFEAMNDVLKARSEALWADRK